MKPMRIAILIVVGVAVIVAFVWALRPQPVPVDLAMIGRGTLEITVADEGVARVAEVYTVSAPVPGRVLRAPLDPGDRVVRNKTVVATIEPQMPTFLDTRTRREIRSEIDAARSTLDLAKAEVLSAEAELEYWTAELKRNETLRARGTIAERTFEQARLQARIREAALATAQAAVAVREGQLHRAEARLIEPEEIGIETASPCCLHIRAPVDGRVLEVNVESETVVGAGQPILSIGDPSDLEIVVDLLSADAVRIAGGALATIERWGGPVPLRARVRRIETAGFEEVSALGIDEQRVRVKLDIESPPEEWRRLGHEYRVFARILAERHDDALLVPISALFREGGDWAVFVFEAGHAAARVIQVGPMNDRHAVILSGLEEGDVVVLHPSDRVEDGGPIVDRSAL